ncbi:hypothetical protein MLD38_023107 [Melastoma candidum]|uniref:Uncharacterized protein n=1 Tax=Melastoma candidum TaxID=119954 RepID=A0ACB9QN98_9MYRT|nr:hypothetical protein MLD38_023107 [Melastoma candidum]
MINIKKLLQLATKCQRMAAIGGKKISLGRISIRRSSGKSSEAWATKRGHFAVYSMDDRRFEIPVSYLDNRVIRDLFTIEEEKFGITSDGPIVLPSDATSRA